MRCGETKTKYERGKATGVEVGKTYVFRVRAENAGGVGPPGPESDNLKCKYKALKPRIDRKSLREITIRVGESLTFDVDILGEPAPDTTWTKDGKTLSDSDTRTIKHKPYKTSMYVDEATRKDDGVYLINAVNIHGKDAAEVRVYVIGPPGPPEGPMDITGIHKNGCKIAWKPPKDDDELDASTVSPYKKRQAASPTKLTAAALAKSPGKKPPKRVQIALPGAPGANSLTRVNTKGNLGA